MGVKVFTEEVTSSFAPARLFNALIVDSHNLVPKLLPDTVKSVDVTPGEGGAATIAQINFADGKVVKHKFETVDKETFHCKYALIEGEELKNGIESIVYELKFEEASGGGSVCKRTVEVHTAEGAEINEEEIKASNERAGKLLKVVEAYLTENPTAYA